MWYIQFSWTILVFVVLFTAVTGSCLEYGHSCWGAHGKRSGNRAAMLAKQPRAYGDSLSEQLFSNQNNKENNADLIDEENNNNSDSSNNKNFNLQLGASASAVAPQSGEATPREERQREVNDAKWMQLLRQQRYQMQRQMQRQFDATDAAESWRRLQKALLAEAEQQQQRQRLQQQQQPSIGDFFELNN